MDDAFLRAEPAQLRVARQAAPEGAEIGRKIVQGPADDVMTKRFDGRDTDFIPAADREGQSMALSGPSVSRMT